MHSTQQAWDPAAALLASPAATPGEAEESREDERLVSCPAASTSGQQVCIVFSCAFLKDSSAQHHFNAADTYEHGILNYLCRSHSEAIWLVRR